MQFDVLDVDFGKLDLTSLGPFERLEVHWLGRGNALVDLRL